MKKKLLAVLQILLPLTLGVFLIWIVARKFTEKDIAEIKQAFAAADYRWIVLSLLIGVLSHASRAWRWKYTLEPLGITPRFYNSFLTVLIGYFVNMAIPRLGEVSRCAIMAKYEKQPFDKLLGTVIAERVADMLILLSLIFIVLAMQFDTLQGLFFSTSLGQQLSGPVFYAVLILGLFGFIVFFRFVQRSSHPFFEKIRRLLGGVIEGMKTIITMKQRWAFIAHTALIWTCYLAMLWISFYALPETSEVPVGGIISCFVMGGITIAATNGGLGAYPLGIQAVLLLYGVGANAGYAFGWILWTAQAAMLISLGALSFVLIPLLNRSK